MNEPAARFALPDFSAPPPEKSRAGKNLVLFAVFFFIAQLALIFFLGTKAHTVPRAATGVPHFSLAEHPGEIIALGDPTLFALPHANDFSAKIWTRTPPVAAPDFRWQEPPRWLALNPNNLGSALNNYLQTNAAAETPLNFKPLPQLDFPEVVAETFFPKKSALQISGTLATRKLLSPIAPPTLVVNDVLAPSRVQLLVAADGSVVSAVLLEPSGFAEADLTALQLARAAQFAPAEQLMLGEMIFKWHTEAVASTNSPDAK